MIHACFLSLCMVLIWEQPLQNLIPHHPCFQWIMFSPVFFAPAQVHHHRAATIYRPISTTHRSSLALRCALNAPSTSTSLSLTEEAEFIEASRNGNLVPLYKCIFADHLTPVLAYRCLVKQEDWESPSFLFESVELGFLSSHLVKIYLTI